MCSRALFADACDWFMSHFGRIPQGSTHIHIFYVDMFIFARNRLHLHRNTLLRVSTAGYVAVTSRVWRSVCFLWVRGVFCGQSSAPGFLDWFAGRAWEVSINGIPNLQNYCVTCTVKIIINMAAVRSLGTHVLVLPVWPSPKVADRNKNGNWKLY